VAGFGRFSGNTGDDFAGLHIQSKDLAISKVAMGVVNHALVNHGGVAIAMLGVVRTKIATPLFIPLMVHTEHDVRLLGRPGEDNKLLICGRCRRRVAAEFVNMVILGLVFFLPENFTGNGIYAEEVLNRFVMIGTGGEELIAPECGGTVPLAGKLKFPFVILVRPGGWHFCWADASAIGTMKPSPLLRKKGTREKKQSKWEKIGTVHNGDF